MSKEPIDRFAAYAPVPLRLFAGTFLVYMSQDNIIDAAQMHEADFIAGVCFLLGLWVRPAAAVMIVNFVVAIVGVHLRLPFRAALEPSAMLASACALLLLGAGALSIDDIIGRRRLRRVLNWPA